MADEIVNRVAKSGLQTLDLTEYAPKQEVIPLDIKDYLFQGMILREKDFREALQEKDWEPFRGKAVAIYCSADAIVPLWAYMLVMTYLQEVEAQAFYGEPATVRSQLFRQALQEQIDPRTFEGARIVIKGCGDKTIPPGAYMALTELLLPYARTIMYGEPCSTVPVFKRKKK